MKTKGVIWEENKGRLPDAVSKVGLCQGGSKNKETNKITNTITITITNTITNTMTNTMTNTITNHNKE